MRALSFEGLTVVHVDDDADHRELFRIALQARGAEVSSFAGVTEALTALEELDDVDVIVSDLAMPDRDGFDLIAAVRESERHGHVPVIGLSAFGSPPDSMRALRGGFDEHISKADGLDEIVAMIVATISRGRSRCAAPKLAHRSGVWARPGGT